jgi:hypothetical protein
MISRILLLPLLCSLLSCSSHAEELPALMGDWQGQYTNPPEKSYQAGNPSLAARVIGVKDGEFIVQLFPEFDKRAQYHLEKQVKPSGNTIEVTEGQWMLKIEGDKMTGHQKVRRKGKEIEIEFELKKVERLSPTMGRKPPEGAEVLFGQGVKNLDAWHHGKDKPATWKILDDGVVEIFSRRSGNKKGGDLMTKKHYTDCEIHLEFRLPYEPNNSGQGRSNSGLFVQGSYEVQILDSYGLGGMWDECGALYRVSPPKLNMCAPPGQWQTYDIIFRAAQYDGDKVVEYPVCTVQHNGKLIHNQQILKEVTQYFETNRKKPPLKEAGPIRLQDHGHPIQFRNFWIKEL